jgi:hypothetical protein
VVMRRMLLALMLLSPPSFGEDIDVKINCKVLDQVVIDLDDGKSTRYGGFTDGADIGDEVSFSFSFTDYPALQEYAVTIRNSQFPAVFISRNISTGQPLITDNSIIVWTELDSFGDQISSSLGESYMRIEGNGNGHTVAGRRYYKNDWSFFVKGGVATETHFLQTLNCLNVPSAYGEMLAKILSYHKGG